LVWVFLPALGRLGYDVVACDRYSSYGDASGSNVELMRAEGIRIVSTNRESELEQIAGLGRFDMVLGAGPSSSTFHPAVERLEEAPGLPTASVAGRLLRGERPAYMRHPMPLFSVRCARDSGDDSIFTLFAPIPIEVADAVREEDFRRFEPEDAA
jgi:hypothetical protein